MEGETSIPHPEKNSVYLNVLGIDRLEGPMLWRAGSASFREAGKDSIRARSAEKSPCSRPPGGYHAVAPVPARGSVRRAGAGTTSGKGVCIMNSSARSRRRGALGLALLAGLTATALLD